MERYKNPNSTINHAALRQTHQPAAHPTPRQCGLSTNSKQGLIAPLALPWLSLGQSRCRRIARFPTKKILACEHLDGVGKIVSRALQVRFSAQFTADF